MYIGTRPEKLTNKRKKNLKVIKNREKLYIAHTLVNIGININFP